MLFSYLFLAVTLAILEQVLCLPITPANIRRASGNSSIGNFGSCSIPQIRFGTGFDNRKETSFEPVDQTSYNHGSAQNIDIITQFMCDSLVNTCGADQTAKNTCATAKTVADSKPAKTGAQADAFNAVFGIKTDFAAVAEVDDQGNIVGGAASTSAALPSSTSGIGNFGSCSVPQIEFGTGFDGRKETSFQPVNKTSYNHGSAQNIDVITQFMCDALVNTCGADQTAKDTCATAKTAADSKTAKTGAQADAFNAVFGIKTDFTAVVEVDDTGNVVGSASLTTASATASAAASSSSAGIGNFGSCSIPKIEFATGFDGRKETSFQPTDKTSYNHGSAQNIDIITQFICDTLVNTCNADQTAKTTCATAKIAADSRAAKTGAQADAFNAVFGIKTDFTAVAEVDDQGNTVGSTTPSATPSASSSSASATATATASGTTSPCGSSTTSSKGNFGSCSIPQIEFGASFDGRKETSFQPVDKQSYNHGSAQNIDVITQFMCDALVNTCGADQTAKSTCAAAKTAADSKTAKTGAQADAFNAIFGIITNFAAVAEVDDVGNIVNGTSSTVSNTS